MQVPIVDFALYNENDPATLTALADEIDHVLSDVGFMSVINLGIEWELVEKVFQASKDFFHSSDEVKKQSGYLSSKENFGYQKVGEENLDPDKPHDLKETFTMRNILNVGLEDGRWPSFEFQELMSEFFREGMEAAYRIQRVLSAALGLDQEFFVKYHGGENVTFRLLHYPAFDPTIVQSGQLGAGAHTDYGLTTLLFQDPVGGLEVMDKDGNWVGVDYVEKAIVINCGDLLERWTNGKYRSTPHRVQPKIAGAERFSMALFVDPDTETPVHAIESCVSENNPAKFPPVTAGEHILQKIEATHKQRFRPY